MPLTLRSVTARKFKNALAQSRLLTDQNYRSERIQNRDTQEDGQCLTYRTNGADTFRDSFGGTMTMVPGGMLSSRSNMNDDSEEGHKSMPCDTASSRTKERQMYLKQDVSLQQTIQQLSFLVD